jgi:hypothetical protein
MPRYPIGKIAGDTRQDVVEFVQDALSNAVADLFFNPKKRKELIAIIGEEKFDIILGVAPSWGPHVDTQPLAKQYVSAFNWALEER